jgi:hypothetical protein
MTLAQTSTARWAAHRVESTGEQRADSRWRGHPSGGDRPLVAARTGVLGSQRVDADVQDADTATLTDFQWGTVGLTPAYAGASLGS